ncbi:MAG TPA: hypothetical protein VKB56_14155 [Terriglobales bacterium]|nr:hypothetical protein [Terriglobales bacterium]
MALAIHAEVLDRVVASVNGAPILLSRVDEQARLAALVEGREPPAISAQDRGATLDRMINQILIRQQIVRAGFSATDVGMADRLKEIRTQLNAASDDAWKQVLARYAIDETTLKNYLQAQAEELQFIEARFRPSVQVRAQQIEDFYRSEYLPKLQQRGAAELPLSEVRSQIEQILAERQITSLMNTWLQSLRAQNNIHVWVTFSPEPPKQAAQANPASH